MIEITAEMLESDPYLPQRVRETLTILYQRQLMKKFLEGVDHADNTTDN